MICQRAALRPFLDQPQYNILYDLHVCYTFSSIDFSSISYSRMSSIQAARQGLFNFLTLNPVMYKLVADRVKLYWGYEVNL